MMQKREEKIMNFDDLIVSELGHFGLFQLRSIILVCIPILISAYKSDYIFTAAAIPHRCRISECGEYEKFHDYSPEWIVNAIPETRTGPASCQRYAPSDAGVNGSLDYCPASLFNTSRTVPCDGFVYDRDNTVVYDFDLGCQEWLRALSGTMSNVGMIFGLPITGYISDKFGRRFAITFNVFNFSLIGIIRAFSVNYTMFLFLQFMQLCLGGCIFSAAVIIAAELISPQHRVIISAIMSCMFTIGQMLLACLAAAIRPWRTMTLTFYIPSLVVLVYFWILPESLRWLLSKKKIVQATELLEKAARLNKKQLSASTLESLTKLAEMQMLDNIKKEKGAGPSLLHNVLRSPIMMRRVCITPMLWVTGTLVYYGLSINSTSLSNNIYSNFIWTCAIEIPGFVTGYFLLDKIGRRGTSTVGFIFSGLCNIAFIFIPNDHTTSRLIVYVLGKFGITMVMLTLYLYTSELYPTEFRHRLLAFSSMIGRLGSITATLTPALMMYWVGLPSLIFGLMGVVSGLLVLLLPETRGTKLPDTFAEAEAIGKKLK